MFNECLHDFLTARVALAPEATAAVFNDSLLTNAQLEQRAEQVACSLLGKGISPGSRIAIQVPRSLDMLAGVIGILKAGCTCVPIDPEDTDERRAAILDHCDAQALVVDQASANAEGVWSGATLTLDHLLDSPRTSGAQSLPTVNADHLAFVFYTSGSTGQPKGVMLSHRALVSGQRWLQTRFPLNENDRQLLRTTLSVTNLVREIFWPLLSGCVIVVLPPGEHRSPSKLVQTINQSRISVFLAVPALLAGMIEEPELKQNRSLRYVFSSSDVMPGDLPSRFFACDIPARLFNLYGLTEALYSCHWECLPEQQYLGFVPVGFPAELTPVIVDESLRKVADAQPGELLITGVGIADGYFKQPELTRERFVQTPYGMAFRTGDIARQDADGQIDLLGRIDDQLKVAGYRVEPGEIEVQLTRCPGVKEAVVVGIRSPSGNTRLSAYLTVEAGSEPSAAELRASLASRLPDYMLPARFLIVNAIPYTDNGKVDRKSLRDSSSRELELSEDNTRPTTDTQARIAALWEEVLGMKNIGIHDNFFSLGGDSIQGFLISAKARQIGIKLSATQVFETPTVAEMAVHVECRGLDEPSVSDRPPAANDTAFVPDDAVRKVMAAHGAQSCSALTDMQKGMLFHSLLDPDSGVYFEQFIYHLEGSVVEPSLRKAWEQVVQRHEILRTAVVTDGLREPLQFIHEHASLDWTSLDLSGVAPDQVPSSIEAYLSEDRRRGFAYERAPLFRLTLITLGNHQYKLVMSYHHLILDAWSLFILLSDSLEFYRAELDGTPPALAQARPFRDYVTALTQEDVAAAQAYWKNRLKDFNTPTIISQAEKLNLSASAQELHAEARLDLTELETERLQVFGRQHQLTLNTLVQGAWALVLAKHSQQRDICFGITITHRPVDLAGVQDMVGIFINSLPMRLNITPQATLDQWLQEVQSVQVGARAYEHYPLPLVQAGAEVASDQPLFETLLIFENFPRTSDWRAKKGIKIRQERYVGWTNYPFAIEAMPEETLYFQVKYDKGFFSPAKVSEVLEDFRSILNTIGMGTLKTLGELVGQLNRTVAAENPGHGTYTRGHASLPVQPTGASGQAQERLAGIWQQALELDQIDVFTPFLALGGNSLLALQVYARSRMEGFDFELKDLLSDNGTIEHLASFF
ncbi:amino acid adenylation domain-containing protein [Pseudomonas sp. HS6]|uniref:amino acid adenylation domain-containing protein n=1 Tax=Pseudomonas sp. HS6 TaxID=2850559 RepID=UPI002019B225|nr:amino acid adenylation domain-containing protein [Pseudomonas sp. HS6]UQS17170.1 amino acid adenylation domain-containing protein [Pseudomonas sp. HS6]